MYHLRHLDRRSIQFLIVDSRLFLPSISCLPEVSPFSRTRWPRPIGGILAGRAITTRPDLFGAAVMQVGMLDAIRAETTTNGVPNVKEFGTVTDEEGFKGLLAMSSYHHVREGVNYPATLLTHGYNDNRVNVWMSGKMAARLQAANGEDGAPVLLRVVFDAGHGIGSTRDQVLLEIADTYSFLFSQLDKDQH